MDEIRSPWSPPRRARTARGIRPTTPTSCFTLENLDEALFRGSLVSGSPVSPYAVSSWRQRPPSSPSAGGHDRDREHRAAARSPSARSRRPEVRAPFIVPPPNNCGGRGLRVPRAPALSLPSTPMAQHSQHSTHRSSGGSMSHSQPLQGGSFNGVTGPRRALGSLSAPSAPTISIPTSPANSPQGVLDSRPSFNARGAAPSPLAATSSESDMYATQMAAVTDHLQRLHDERTRKNPSPCKALAGSGSVAQRRTSHSWMWGEGSARVSHAGNGSGLRDRESILHGQISVAAMQQRLQHKFGEEAAAFMLHDLKEVPEHLHVLFYTVILTLRELPSPLPASLGEAYAAVFAQHFDRTVSAAERRHAAFRTQIAQLQVQTAMQLDAMQQKVSELSPRGARPTAQAQLQQLQRQVQQQAGEHQGQLKTYAAQVIAAQEMHAQLMRLLCVTVAAQERLSREQLASMGLDGVLEHLPAWEVLFHAREGVLMMADPSLEAWLVDRKAAKQFACDPRVGHAVLGQHYRQVAERDVRGLDLYGLRYAVLHLLLSDEEVTGGERLLMDPEYMEQVFRHQEEGTLYLTLLRLTHKTEVVAESLRWLRNNMGALRSYPRAVPTLWQAAPSRTLFARLAAAFEGRPGGPAVKRLHRSSADDGGGAAAVAAASDWPLGGGGTAATSSSQLVEVEADGDSLPSSAAATKVGVGADPLAIPPLAEGHLLSPRRVGGASAETGAGGRSGAARRPTRPQCRLLNPPPFWPAVITQLPGHAGGVTSLVFDRRNRLLAAATAAGNVLVWDHATARRVGTLNGYSPVVPCVDMHPAGKLIAVGSSTDCTVRIRALDSGCGPLLMFTEPQPDPVVKALTGAKNSTVRHLSYSPDGHLLAVVYGDGTVTVWDPVKGVRSSTMPVLNKTTAARYASFAPNGQLLALACANGTIRVWHLERLNPLHISVLRAYDPHVAIRVVLYSPSGLLLASLAEGASEVLLWDVSSGHQLQALAGPPGSAPVRALAFNPGGLLLATAGEDGDVAIWNANTRGQWTQAAVIRGHAFAVNALAFSPCGLVLATGGNEDGVRLWDVGAILNRSEAQRADLGYGLAAGSVPGGGGTGSAAAAAMAAAAQAACVTIRGDELATCGRHPAPGIIACLTHSPNGTQLAAGMADGAVCVWDCAAPRRSIRLVAQHRRPVGRVVYSGSGDLLASASDDGCVCIWNTSAIDVAGTQLVTIIHVDAAFGDGGAGGAASDDPYGWSTTRGSAGGGSSLPTFRDNLPNGHTGNGPGTIGGGGGATAWAAPGAASGRRPAGAGGWVTSSCSVALSPNGAYLASAHDDGSVVLWTLPAGAVAVRLQGHSQLAYGLQYSPDGRLLASTSDDGVVCVWEPGEALRAVGEDRVPAALCLLEHTDHVYAVDFSPNGSTIATISRDGALCTWDARTGSCTGRTPHGHATDTKASVDGVRYSPTGLLLATWSGKDAAVRLWHAASCVLLRELTGLQMMTWSGLGPAPWAAVLRVDYAPFVVRLPERGLLLEAAAIQAGAPADSPDVAAAVADEVAEGLAGATIGLPPPPQTGPLAQRRQMQLQQCQQLSFRPLPDPMQPIVADKATPLRPCVRIFSGTRAVPHVSLRGRSLVLADSASTAFYSVAHDASSTESGGPAGAGVGSSGSRGKGPGLAAGQGHAGRHV